MNARKTTAASGCKASDKRPRYILLCVDAEGAHWVWRTHDDAVFFVTDGTRAERLSVADHAPEQLVARVADERGLRKQYYAGSMAAALFAGVE